MTHRHSSHYFDNIEMFLGTHPDYAPLAVLRNAVSSSGCPEDLTEDVINSAIAQEYNRIISPKEKTVTVINNGEVMPSTQDYNPTYGELIKDMIARFTDLDEARIKCIVDALIKNGAITIYEDGRLYRTKALIPRMIINI